jgi:hypothetical protein
MYKKVAESGLRVVETATKKTLEERNKIIGQNIFETTFPIILYYVFSKVKKSWGEFFPRLLEVRESKEAKAYRQLCEAIDIATKDNDMALLANVLDEFSRKSSEWKVKSELPPMQISIAFPPAIEFDPFEVLSIISSKRKRHLLFLDNLYVASVKPNGFYKKIEELEP